MTKPRKKATIGRLHKLKGMLLAKKEAIVEDLNLLRSVILASLAAFFWDLWLCGDSCQEFTTNDDNSGNHWGIFLGDSDVFLWKALEKTSR